MREEIIKEIEAQKLIAILRGVPCDELLPTAEALYRGGIRLLEITYGREEDKQVADNIKGLVKCFEGRMLIGAGTVIKPEQVELTAKAGGCFIISPDTNKEVIESTRNRGLVSIPGALTPTEIAAAHNFGADFVKLFPISCFDADYVKAVKAPLGGIKLLAVGGINENNMSYYLKAGICGFGIGSNMADWKLIEKDDWQGITVLAKKYKAVIDRG